MSEKSRNFLLLIGGSIIVVLLIALAAALAYSAGRNSIPEREAHDEIVGVVEELIQDASEQAESPADDLATELSLSELSALQEDGEIAPEPTLRTRVVTDTVEIVPVDLKRGDLDILIEVWDIVDREFDGQLPASEHVQYGAVMGSLELLGDQFTRFIPPEIAERAREQLAGSFEGVGAFVDMSEDGYLIIVRPIQGQPAAHAGLETGDLVTHVDGISVFGKSLDAIINEVKGPKGTVVTLTIVRDSVEEPFDVTITRDRIEIPIVESEFLDNDIGYVRLTSFSSNAVDQLREAIIDLFEQDPKALILDLRDNPGGFLYQSVAVADLFLPDGIVLYQRDGSGREEIFESDDGDLAENITLVVLVNEGSASASEIVAGAIQDTDRGILIGQTTLGKGLVQQTHTLSDGSELRVTIARWYTPDNNSIDSEGIPVDIQVDTPEIFGGEEDTQLQRAIQFVLDGK